MQTAVRPQQKTDTINSTQSMVLMKKMVLAGVSEICYLRSLFPDDSFDEVNLGDNRVHMLRAPEDPASGIGVLRKSLESAFEALELRYLRSMSLAIFSGPEDDPGRKLFEAFNFIFKYPDDQTVQATLVQEGRDCTPAKIRMQGNSLLKLLFALCSNMSPLPPSPVLEIKLFYREEVTPADYNPPHYTDATHDQHLFFEDQPTKVPLGRLVTPHHTMSLLAAFVPASQDAEEVADKLAGLPDASAEHVGPEEQVLDEHRPQEEAGPAAAPSPLARFLTLPAAFPDKGVDPLVYLISRAALAGAASTSPSSSSALSLAALRGLVEGYGGPLPLAALAPGSDAAEDDASLWRTYIGVGPKAAAATTGVGVTMEQMKRLVAVLVGEGLLVPAGGGTKTRGRAATSWTLTSELAPFAPAIWGTGVPQTGMKRGPEHRSASPSTEDAHANKGQEEALEEAAAPPPPKRARGAASAVPPASTASGVHTTAHPAAAAAATRSKGPLKPQVAAARVAVPEPAPAPSPAPAPKARVAAPAPSPSAPATAPLGGSGSTALPALSKAQGLSSVPFLPGQGAATTTTGWATATGRSVWTQHSMSLTTRLSTAGGSATDWGASSEATATFGRGSPQELTGTGRSSNPFSFGEVSVPSERLQPTPQKGGIFAQLSSVSALTAPAPRRPATAPGPARSASAAPACPTAVAKGPAAGQTGPARPVDSAPVSHPAHKQQQPPAALPRRPASASAAAPVAASTKARGRPLMANAAARLFDF